MVDSQPPSPASNGQAMSINAFLGIEIDEIHLADTFRSAPQSPPHDSRNPRKSRPFSGTPQGAHRSCMSSCIADISGCLAAFPGYHRWPRG